MYLRCRSNRVPLLARWLFLACWLSLACALLACGGDGDTSERIADGGAACDGALGSDGCAEDQYCDQRQLRCFPKRSVAEGCAGPEQCLTGVCDPVGLCGPCEGPDDCADGEFCDSGAEVPGCALCDGACRLCEGAGSDACTGCSEGSYLLGQMCLPCSACPVGQYAQAACVQTADTVCVGCAAPCGSCDGGSVADCLTCSDGSVPVDGGCLPPPGSACADPAECQSGHCVEGVCCDVACSANCSSCLASLTGGQDGLCAGMRLGTDPEDACPEGSCNGFGLCALDQGRTCDLGAQCLSGECADGVCCEMACGGLCRACSGALTGGVDGACGWIPAGADPQDECSTGACTGEGACTFAPGAGCANGGECPSGFCADGECCDVACDGLCESCAAIDSAGADGVCAAIPTGADPDRECGKGGCDGFGACFVDLLEDGAACMVASECESGFCADGLCCDSACGGICQACSAESGGKDGICTNIAAGQDPAEECPEGSCGGAGVCVDEQVTVCSGAGDCELGFCVDGVCCDNACDGLCQACSGPGGGAVDGICASIEAGSDPDGECPAGVCDGSGGCALQVGQRCGEGDACLSGHCVDGICCESACGGSCRSCVGAQTGAQDGSCGDLRAGTDPDDECPAGACDGAGGCGADGGGGCSVDADCLAGPCVDGVCCDGLCEGLCRSCRASRTGGVDGVCAAVVAGSDPDGECGAGLCDGSGGCLLGDGEPCDVPGECAAGFCVDGVCCEDTCQGTCRSCSGASTGQSDGICAAVSAGSDPDGECGGGTCDGATGCLRPNGVSCSAGAECVSGHCVDGVCCDAACEGLCRSCSGAGTGGADGACAAVSAGGDPDDECGGGVCDGVAGCLLLDGASCGAGSECASGQCVDGVCCGTACEGLCQSCSGTSTGQADGVCAPIEAGSDPEDECDGALACDGAAACET